MVSDFSPAVSTVICIDLLNASAEDIAFLDQFSNS